MEMIIATSMETVCAVTYVSPEAVGSDETGLMAPGLVHEIRL